MFLQPEKGCRMRRRYNENDIKYIKECAENGVEIKNIADTFGVTIEAIHHVLSRNNIKFCKKPLTHIPNEIWIDCIDIHDIQISNMGRFLRKSTKTLIDGYITSGGYVTVEFSGIGRFSAHRLIAKAFIPNYENKPEVNHKNGVKTDNSVNNLEWVTPSENVRHSINTGLSTFKSGQEHHRTALNEEQIKTCSELRSSGKTYLEIGAIMGVTYRTVSRHLNKQS